eukprot:1377649-Alexandrium_andersonii.AAC.1
MSASLVGSEMCIRDRGKTALSAARNLQNFGAPPQCRSGRRRLRAKRGAVSYTHLTLPTICSV